MSVLDKWLSKYAHNGEVATFATTATKRNTTHPVNGLVVANQWRQSGDIPDFPRTVAALSPADGDRKTGENQLVAANVAVVAPVATPSSDHWRLSSTFRIDPRRSSVSSPAAMLPTAWPIGGVASGVTAHTARARSWKRKHEEITGDRKINR